MLPHDGDLKRALQHVLWLGGPPDAGKTSVAQLLAGKHALQLYHFDRREMDHIRRADPLRHPALSALRSRLAALDERAFLDRLWVTPAPEEMARETIASWSERVGLAVEDLLAMPGDRPIIAEGPGFFPEVVLPLLSSPRQAIWLVPTEGFKRASHERRGKSAFKRAASDPERATRNHIARDLLLAEHYRQTARELRLPLIEVDGTRPAEEVAAAVEAHFAPWLPAVLPASGSSLT